MSSQAIPVLLYHAVPASASGDPLAVTRKQFASHIEAVLDSGRTPVTVGEIAAGLRGERALPHRPVAITFDDAYEDTLAAVEMLCASQLRAGVYVTSGQVNSGSMIRGEQLQRLAEMPEMVELGAHTVTHPALDELGLIEIEREVADSRRALQEMIGRELDAFAYPFGAYDRRVRAAVIEAGFRSAAAVKNALSHRGDDPWAIARFTVGAETSAERIAQVLAGRGIPRAWHRERLRTRGYRAARRFKRRVGLGAGSWR